MYNRYSASVRAEIGRYASRHGVAAASYVNGGRTTCSFHHNVCEEDLTVVSMMDCHSVQPPPAFFCLAGEIGDEARPAI